ncbi:S1 family peptidase [Leucobacter sp. USHLN153]|uniref:S1 family peptidase n=1 Tax=Leucobacter sp. USHLN153 TaxID=3081268 RepID=UPI00301946A6
MTQRRPIALGAAITIGFGSLFISAPAFADDETPTTDQQEVLEAPAEETSVPEEAPDEAAEALEDAGVEVVALGVDGDGVPVVVQTEGSETGAEVDAAIEAYAAQLGAPSANVQTVSSAPVAYAATDVVGGAGYLAFEGEEGVSFCSIGFSAWSPEGEPALLSAGHCTDDGAYSGTALVKPSVQPAVTGDLPGTGNEQNGTGMLGEFGFSQFGGTNNSDADLSVSEPVPDPEGTDVSIIENIGSQFDLRPEITDWSTAEDDDLAAKTIAIKSVKTTDPTEGSAVSKSGRTTGYTSGTVGALVDGWSIITTPDGDPRWVRGFQSDVLAAPGDSGGAVFQGNSAIGVISGGSPASGDIPQFTWTASLKHILPHIPGYEVALDIDEPTVDTDLSEAIDGGSEIVVSAPSNATRLSVGTQNSGDSVPVENGKATFKVSDIPGQHTLYLTATNSLSHSETVEVDFTVQLGAPKVKDVDTTDSDVTLTGTGVAGADITAEFNGDTFTAMVGQDSKWEIELSDVEIGEYDVSVRQEFEGNTSDAATGKVIVRPTPVTDLSIENGTTYEAEKAPSELSGRGLNGADVTVLLNGEDITAQAGGASDNIGALAVAVEDEAWTASFGAQLGAGSYALEVTQAVNGISSAPVSIVFNVAVPTVDPVAPVTPTDPGAGADPTQPAAPGDAGAGGADLPVTGFDAGLMLPLGLSALAMLIIGGAAILVAQRRFGTNHSE